MHTRISRLGIIIAFSGISVLGASLFHWNQTTHSRGVLYSDNDYQWVLANLSVKPALAQDEIWELPSACVKPFYLAQAQDFENKLTAHKVTKPPPVVLDPPKKQPYAPLSPELQRQSEAWERQSQVSDRNWAAINQVGKAFGSYDTSEFETIQEALKTNNLAIDPLWVATQVRLQLLIKRWKDDAADVKDKRVAKSDVLDAIFGRANISNLRVSMAITDAKNNDDKFDVAAKYLLGLSAFTDEVAKTIRSQCLELYPVKRIVSQTTYGTDIERWPIESPASFWVGAALAIFGLLLGPLVFWVRAGRP